MFATNIDRWALWRKNTGAPFALLLICFLLISQESGLSPEDLWTNICVPQQADRLTFRILLPRARSMILKVEIKGFLGSWAKVNTDTIYWAWLIKQKMRPDPGDANYFVKQRSQPLLMVIEVGTLVLNCKNHVMNALGAHRRVVIKDRSNWGRLMFWKGGAVEASTAVKANLYPEDSGLIQC